MMILFQSTQSKKPFLVAARCSISLRKGFYSNNCLSFCSQFGFFVMEILLCTGKVYLEEDFQCFVIAVYNLCGFVLEWVVVFFFTVVSFELPVGRSFGY